MRTIVLTKKNIINSSNSVFKYDFPATTKFFNDYISLSQINLYYSWYNISERLRNNVFKYKWMAGNILTTYTIKIDDGLYEIEQLNEFLQFQFIQRSHYLIDSAGDNVYYLEFLINASRYAVMINSYQFPSQLPLNYSTPVDFGEFPSQPFNPVLQIDSRFNEIVGYSPDFTTDLNLNNSYIPNLNDNLVKKSDTTISYLSTTAPILQESDTILISIPGVIDNVYSQPTSILYSVSTQNVGFSELISQNVPNYCFNKLLDGSYSSITVNLLNTKLENIQILDPSISIILVIKNRDEF